MRDIEYDGRVQRLFTMVRGEKTAKGIKAVLEERGIKTAVRKAEWVC